MSDKEGKWNRLAS